MTTTITEMQATALVAIISCRAGEPVAPMRELVLKAREAGADWGLIGLALDVDAEQAHALYG
jgi:hypothetical protein